MQVLGKNQLPSFFSSTDIEVLERCICGSRNLEALYQEFGLGIERCKDCGVVRTNPRLRQSAIQRCYEENAKHHNVFGQILGAKKLRAFPWRDVGRRYRALAQQLRRLFSKEESPRLLEVGFGGGLFLDYLKSAGFEVHGFDVSLTAVQHVQAKGIPATCAESLREAEFPEASFDVVVMWEVFEHIPEPNEFAVEVFRILKPGGFWLLQVPNWNWLNLKTKIVTKLPGKKSYVSRYGLIAPLFHLYHYTYQSLKNLLERHGFRHRASSRIRMYEETNWESLAAHEAFYLLDSLPAALTRNRYHHNVVLCELYQKPGK